MSFMGLRTFWWCSALFIILEGGASSSCFVWVQVVGFWAQVDLLSFGTAPHLVLSSLGTEYVTWNNSNKSNYSAENQKNSTSAKY